MRRSGRSTQKTTCAMLMAVRCGASQGTRSASVSLWTSTRHRFAWTKGSARRAGRGHGDAFGGHIERRSEHMLDKEKSHAVLAKRLNLESKAYDAKKCCTLPDRDNCLDMVNQECNLLKSLLRSQRLQGRRHSEDGSTFGGSPATLAITWTRRWHGCWTAPCAAEKRSDTGTSMRKRPASRVCGQHSYANWACYRLKITLFTLPDFGFSIPDMVL